MPGPEAPISAVPKLHELEASLNAVIRGKSDVIRLSVVYRGRAVPAGVYFYRLDVGYEAWTRSLVLVR